jgi:hypothetical protein
MVFSNNLLLGAVSAAASDYLIEQSLLFDGTSVIPYPHPFGGGEPQDLDVFLLG